MKCRHFGFALFLLLAVGCSAPAKKEQPQVFYPPPPDPARIQYLTSFTTSTDVEKEKTGFEQFVIGQEGVLRLDKPYGAAIHDGKIYVCDTNRTVVVFDLKNRTFGPMKGVVGQGKLVQPLNISIDRDGNKYVSDPIRNQVVVYDKDDQYARFYAAKGAWKPVDAVVYEDRVYVADMKGGVIRVFDRKSGDLVKSFGKDGKPEENIGAPVNLTFDKDGNLYVTDFLRVQVLKYDRDGHYLDSYGKLGTNLGHFSRPRGTSLDRENRLFVVDAAYSNVQLFNRAGFVLLFFAGPGAGPGDLVLPAKVVVDYDNLKYFEKYINPNFEAEYLLLVTSQFGDSMVNVYAFGKEKGKKYLSDDELLEEVRKKQQQKEFQLQNVPEEN